MTFIRQGGDVSLTPLVQHVDDNPEQTGGLVEVSHASSFITGSSESLNNLIMFKTPFKFIENKNIRFIFRGIAPDWGKLNFNLLVLMEPATTLRMLVDPSMFGVFWAGVDGSGKLCLFTGRLANKKLLRLVMDVEVYRVISDVEKLKEKTNWSIKLLPSTKDPKLGTWNSSVGTFNQVVQSDVWVF